MLSKGALVRSLLAISLWVCSGCTPRATGAFSPRGYQSTIYDYQVAATQNGGLLPTSWRLDNYYQGAGGGLDPKDVDPYVTELAFDFNGDGNYETNAEEFTYDLRFKHLVHDGVIFVRTIPISAELRLKSLDALMDRYVEQISGAGYEVVSLGANTAAISEKRYAAGVTNRASALLGGQEACVTTLEVANVDQVKIDPNARKERVQLVLLHTDFQYRAENTAMNTTRTFPVVMFAGYANQPRDFNAGLKDFHDFLSRVTIHGKSGFAIKETVVDGVPAPATASAPTNPQSVPGSVQ